jgi:O-antigen/teichoic acid export membrane protein
MKRFSATILRNSIFGLAASFLMKLISFTFSVVIVRRLGVQDYGQYSAVLAFGTTFAIFSDLGLGIFGVRQVARWRDLPDWRERSQELYVNIIGIRLILSVFTAILVISAAWITGRSPLILGAIAINTLSLFLYAFEGAEEAVLSGLERMDKLSSFKVLAQITFLVAGGVALVSGTGYYGLIGANLLSVLVLTIFLWRNLSSFGLRIVRPSYSTWLKLLKASLPFGVLGFALGLSYKFDSVLLNIFRGDAETGYYNAAYGIVFSAILISNVLNTSLFPSLTRQVVSEPGQLARISERVFRYLMILALPITFGGWALAGDVMNFLYTDRFAQTIPAFRILVWVIPLMYMSEFLGYLILIQDKERSIARAVVISSSFNCILNLFLVPRFGYLAAAGMTVLTEIVLLAQYFWELREILREFNWFHSFLAPLLSAMLMCMGVLILRPYVPLLVNIGAGGILYLVVLILFKGIGKQEISLFQEYFSPSKVKILD